MRANAAFICKLYNAAFFDNLGYDYRRTTLPKFFYLLIFCLTLKFMFFYPYDIILGVKHKNNLNLSVH